MLFPLASFAIWLWLKIIDTPNRWFPTIDTPIIDTPKLLILKIIDTPNYDHSIGGSFGILIA